MKTERRHELETNQLADSLAHGIDRVQPYLRLIAGVMIGALVLLFAVLFINRQSAAKSAQGWDDFFLAISKQNAPTALEDVAEKYAGTPAGIWAALTMADLELNDGTDKQYSDKALAKDKLESAAGHYQDVIAATREPVLLARATFGKAKTNESLGNLKIAREGYESVQKNWPGTVYETAARQRLKDLDRPETKEFYAWFGAQSPGKTMAREPGVPGMKLPFDLDSIADPQQPASSGIAAPNAPGPDDAVPAGNPSSEGAAPADNDATDSAEPAEQPASKK